MSETESTGQDLEALVAQILAESDNDNRLTEEQKAGLKAHQELHRPFRFTTTQRAGLKNAWGGGHRGISSKRQEKIDLFLEYSEQVLYSWKHHYRSPLRLTERRDQARKVCKLTSELRKAFKELTAPDESRLILDAYATVRLSLERRYEDHEINRALEQIDRPSVFALIEPLLRLLEDGSGRIERATKPPPGEDRRLNKILVNKLATEYKKAFGKVPSSKENGNFVRYIRELYEVGVIDTPIGIDLVKQVLGRRKTSNQTS